MVRTEANFVVLLTCSDGFWDTFLNWLLHFQNLQLVAPDVRRLPVHLFADDDVTLERCQRLLENNSDNDRSDDDNSTNTNMAPTNTLTLTPKNKVRIGQVNLTCLPHTFAFPDANPADLKTKFKDMMGRRPAIVLRELERGHDVIFTDVDVVWRKDPMGYFNFAEKGGGMAAAPASVTSEVHLWAQRDELIVENITTDGIMVERERDYLCAGFAVFRSCPETIAFVDLWRMELEGREENGNQPTFNRLLWMASMDGIGLNDTSLSLPMDVNMSSIKGGDHLLSLYSTLYSSSDPHKKLYMNPQTLPPKLFASGSLYFTPNMTNTERNDAVTAHNNYVHAGYAQRKHMKKVHRFKRYGLWLLGEGEKGSMAETI